LKRNKEIGELKPFKVTNPHTIFLNSQTPTKPLYTRINELMKEKQGLLDKRKHDAEKMKENLEK